MYSKDCFNIIKAFHFLILIIAFPQVLAEMEPVEVPEKPLLEQVENETVKEYLVELKGWQSTIGDYVQGFGEGLDNFFGDETLEIKGKGNRLDVQLPVRLYSGGRTDSKMNFKLKLDMPRTNKRWQLFITSLDEDDKTIDDPDTLNRSPTETLTQTPTDTATVDDEKEQRVGGRYLLGTDESRLSNVDVGLKFINYIEPNPFIKYRERFKYDLDTDISIESRTTHTIYIEKDDGFAWELQQVFDHQINQKELGRSQTELTWWRNDKELLINQKFIHFQRPNPFRATAYFIDANWLATAAAEIDFKSVALGTSLREQIYHDWLFFEIEPRVTWFQQSDQLSTPQYSLRLMLEMRFYR